MSENNLPATIPHEQPFSRMPALPGSVNHGAVAIEQERAIAEAQGQIIIAKKFPRNINAAYAEVMEACKLPAMAEVAFYTIPQGGKSVTGPSIKLIEQIAQSMTNMEWGHRELGRIEAGPGPTDFGRSEVMVFAWDKEKNNFSPRQITVLHVMDTKDGKRKLRDERDIDNRIANVASKQMRGRLQALLPKWLIEAAVAECKKTLAGNNDKPVAQRIRDMIGAFSKQGVTVDHLETHLGHRLDETTIDELVDLTGIYNAIKEGAKASDYFGTKEEKADGPSETASGIAATAKAAAAQASPAPAPTRRTQASKPVQETSKPVKETPAEPEQKSKPEPEVNKQEAAAPEPAAAPAPSQADEQPSGPADDDEVF